MEPNRWPLCVQTFDSEARLSVECLRGRPLRYLLLDIGPRSKARCALELRLVKRGVIAGRSKTAPATPLLLVPEKRHQRQKAG